ncbi:MAG TPA: arginase [Chloroflexota bacterium]
MQVAIIGAPVDLGADRRGVDMGPSAIRYADLETQLRDAGITARDDGNVAAPVPESAEISPTHMKYLDSIVSVSQQLSAAVASRVADGWFPLVLGGDHSVSLGSVAGVTKHRKVGIIWLDAHGDFNTAATSPSGNIHGMVLAALAGQGDSRLVDVGHPGAKVECGNIALIGVRNLDPGERSLLRQCGVTVFTMHDVDRIGLPAVTAAALDRASEGVDGIHLSLDLDVVDPIQAPGVGTPVLGGLTYREAHLAMELLAESGLISSLDVVEVNPILDTHNETAKLAVQLVLSALGKRIL